jgi:hypothetical protein
MVFLASRPPFNPPFLESSFTLAFRKGTDAWRIEATDKQVNGGGELWQLNLNPGDVGDRAALCFVAHDKVSGRLREWMQRYKITQANASSVGVNFIPDGEPRMRLTDGEVCDGVKEVRNQASAAVGVAGVATPSSAGLSQNDLIKQQLEQITAMQQERLRRMGATRSDAFAFARISAEGSRRDRTHGNQWQIKIDTQSFRVGTPLYDVNVQANVVEASGQVTPLQLSNRQLFVNIESRYAFVDRVGTKAVVCLTAKDPTQDKPYRMTQWFSIETSRVAWQNGGVQVPGEKATFVPSQPPTLTEASDAPCK